MADRIQFGEKDFKKESQKEADVAIKVRRMRWGTFDSGLQCCFAK